MDSRQRKRRSHVPSRSEAVKLPKSRCSGKKFLSIMDTLPMDKKNAISDMGFGGLLLGCKELRYELITWIVAKYDIGYHRLCMETKVVVPVMPKDVREVLGIPDNGVDILIYNRRGTPNRTYDIKILEANLRDLPVFYITKFYMTAFQVEVHSPLSAAWTDEQVIQGSKPSAHNDGHPYDWVAHTLMTQLSTGVIRTSYEPRFICGTNIATLHARSSGGQSGCALIPPEEAVNVERKKDEGNTGVHPCSDEMMRKGTGAKHSFWPTKSHRCSRRLCKQPSPTPRRRFKHTTKRLVKPAAICKSPFVSQCVQLFPKISQQERLVADYALSKDDEPRYDCGMFAIKYMEHWNGATLAHSIAKARSMMEPYLHESGAGGAAVHNQKALSWKFNGAESGGGS
ncbi:hypothetical protein CK203_045420 [Vitis vinifera]|uniref:Ubiquitin-like protease family profile domain-containing protein n=1 Tax=Vitis vinifera TaxID=29760 RepID=A0A438H954_VITVI|nr:hypothetical protein CK203_045420 [Vitis vinifera]